MIVLLPHEIQGLAKLEEELTNDTLDEVIESLSKLYAGKVEVSLPRFKFTQGFHLNNILAKMGATDMFSKFDADFKGIAPAHVKLYVSHVIHKAFVESLILGGGVVSMFHLICPRLKFIKIKFSFLVKNIWK